MTILLPTSAVADSLPVPDRRDLVEPADPFDARVDDLTMRVAQYQGCLAASPRACLFVDALDDYRIGFANAAAVASLDALAPALRRRPGPMEGTWLEDWFDVEPFTTAALRRVRREPFVGQLQIGAELLDAYAAPVRGGVPGAPEVIGLFVVWSTATSRAAALAEVAESTAVVRTASDEIAERAQEAVAVVGDAVGSAERAAEVLAGLERASKEIGAVMSVIATIAEQTNLLALNATIEAARAGELGRGFAVVASEVKELARNTAHATTDVENRIRAVVDGTVAAAQSVASISDVVRRIDALQHEIADAVAQQRGSTDDLHEVVLRALG